MLLLNFLSNTRLSLFIHRWWTRWTCGPCVAWATLLGSSSNSSLWTLTLLERYSSIFQVCGDVRLELFRGKAGWGGRTSSPKVHRKNPSLLGHVAPLWQRALLVHAEVHLQVVWRVHQPLHGEMCRPVLGDHVGLLPRLLSSAVCFSFVYILHGEHYLIGEQCMDFLERIKSVFFYAFCACIVQIRHALFCWYSRVKFCTNSWKFIL